MDIGKTFGALGKATPANEKTTDTEELKETITYSPKIMERVEDVSYSFSSMQTVDGKIMGVILLKYKLDKVPKELVMATIKDQKGTSRVILEMMDVMKKQMLENYKSTASYKKVVTSYDALSDNASKAFGDNFQFTPEGMAVFGNVGNKDITIPKTSIIIGASNMQFYKGYGSEMERRSKVKAVVANARQEAEREHKELLLKKANLKKSQMEARKQKEEQLEEERQERLKQHREDLKETLLAKKKPDFLGNMQTDEMKTFIKGEKIAKYLDAHSDLFNSDNYEKNSNKIADFLVETYDATDFQFENTRMDQIDDPSVDKNDFEKLASIKEKGLVATAQQYLKFAQLEGTLPQGVTSGKLDIYNRLLQLIKTERFGNIKLMLNNFEFNTSDLIETLKAVEPDDTELIEYMSKRLEILPTKDNPDKVDKNKVKELNSFIVHSTKRDTEYTSQENEELRTIAGRTCRILKNVANDNRFSLMTYNDYAGKYSAYIYDRNYKFGFTDMETVPNKLKNAFEVTDTELVNYVKNANEEAEKIKKEEEEEDKNNR